MLPTLSQNYVKNRFHSNLKITYILRKYLRNNSVIITLNCWLGYDHSHTKSVKFSVNLTSFPYPTLLVIQRPALILADFLNQTPSLLPSSYVHST